MLAMTVFLTGVLLGSWPDDREDLPFHVFLASMIVVFLLMNEKLGMVILGLFMLATLGPRMVRNLQTVIRLNH